MKKKFTRLILILSMAISAFVQTSYAAETPMTDTVVTEDNRVVPRAILHLTKTQWNSDHTIKVAIQYSMHDSSRDVVGVQGAYISEYSNALYKAVKVTGYGQKEPPIVNLYVNVSYQYHNSDEWHFQQISLVP